MLVVTPLAIPDVKRVEPVVHGDARGYFTESYNARDLNAALGEAPQFVQDNESRSQQYVLRGLHYQIEHAQAKLLRVTEGEIYDVAVDIRRGSPTFGQWVGELLSAENKRQLWVPAGFAHGFVVLSPTAQVQYKVTDYRYAEHERGIRFDDPAIGIDWRLPKGVAPLLSGKDEAAPLLADAQVYG